MPFITEGKTNFTYILIVVVLAAVVGGGILAYQYLWAPKEESKIPTMKQIPSMKELSHLTEPCQTFSTLIGQSDQQYENSYARDLNQDWSLYFSLPKIGSRDNFSVYLHDKTTNCVALLDKVVAFGPGGREDYTAFFHAPTITKISYRDGDLGATWEDTYYLDLQNRERILLTRVSNNFLITFQYKSNRYVLQPIRQIAPNEACDFGNFEYEGKPITVTIVDFQLNEQPLHLLTEPKSFSGIAPNDCSPVKIDFIILSEKLDTALIKYQNISLLEVNLSPIYNGEPPIVSFGK